ncbi:Lipopolysaccharide assembly protein B [Neolewinella maritima]|uniref:Lipopolysaccharide assembly protein B n=1 Tax=Neolewinella maritima TaxID=1383882 RepID=A0ABN8F871_9BACT|nr:tetratricopeptide repeat protein [Neolewinella maritima]CAH1000473.1 Lipopolysaccharide assembly protein B [Neolewinella maritima]
MRTILTSVLPILISCLLISCGGDESSTADTSTTGKDIDIPDLLKRPEALQNAAEWDKTQSGYMQMSSTLRLDDAQAIEPRITLAKIFVNEARVTGEHGHYYPAALKMLDEALELNHDGPRDTNLEFDALATKAGVQLSQHDFKEALATAKQAVSINPYNAQVYGAVVDAHVELGDYPAAIAAADKMNEIRPDLRSYSRVSYLREIHGDVDGAIEAMKRAVNAGAPGYESTAWARLTLGELYHRYGQPEDAAAQYKTILQERPNYPFAIAAQAELAMDREDYEEAERLLIEAKNIIPEVGYYIDLAELYTIQGRDEEAQALKEEILVMLQEDVDSGHNMDMEYAALYRDQYEDYDKALDYMLKEYQVRPNNIDVNRMLASIYLKRGDTAKAKEHLSKAQVTESKHPELQELEAALAK